MIRESEGRNKLMSPARLIKLTSTLIKAETLYAYSLPDDSAATGKGSRVESF